MWKPRDKSADDRLTIQIKVQPNASKSEIVEFADNVLKIKIQAPPVDGKANQQTVALLANALQVKKSDVEIVAGHKSKTKLVKIRCDWELETALKRFFPH
jgi:hypothetical protein